MGTVAVRFLPQPGGNDQRVTSQAKRNPFAMLAIAFATGMSLARWLDWRGHAHPRR
jgi:hypothetical protein